jgi:hypothetical protein
LRIALAYGFGIKRFRANSWFKPANRTCPYQDFTFPIRRLSGLTLGMVLLIG